MKKTFLLILGIVILLVGSVFALSMTQTVTVNILPGGIDVFSPIQDKIYNERQVPINLSMSTEVNYFKYSDNGGNLRTLCRDCDEYGFSKLKRKGFADGFHELIILGIFDEGNVEKRINFTVDSKKPVISITEPGRNHVTNGSDFSMEYTEDNLIEVLLGGNKTVNLTNQCNESGKDVICNAQIDLSAFDGQEIEYWFKLKDIADNTGNSKPTTVLVDTTSPVLTVSSPIGGTTAYGKRIPFNLSVSEKVTLEFMDNSDAKPKWERICSNCDSYGLDKLKTKSFSRGIHNIIIKATDKAGNSDSEIIIFNNGGSDECLFDGFGSVSYSSTNTGEIALMNGYSEFTSGNVDFFRGYFHQRNGEYFGDGSMHASGTSTNGTKIQLNVKFTVAELIEQNCEKITWRNSARGTYWIYREGTKEVKYDYMDITYYFATGKIDAVGVGDVDFEFKGIVDNRV